MNKNFSRYTAFLSIFSLFGFTTMLNRAGFYKIKGLCSVEMIKELLISNMVGKSVNHYAKSGIAVNGSNGTSKSSLYRFMSEPSYSWRSLLTQLVANVVSRTSKLTGSDRIKTFCIDDSVIDRNRSSKVQLSAKVYDHCTHTFLKGFTYLSIAWSDGNSTYPVDFAMVSSAKDKNCLNPVDSMDIDARRSIDKRMIESRRPKTELVVELIDRALNNGIMADYALFDTWFTTESLVTKIRALGLHVIGMVKHMNNACYHYKNEGCFDLKSLYSKLLREGVLDSRKEIMGSVIVKSKKEQMPLKIVFVRNRNNEDKHICLLSTDTFLEDEQIIKTYARRWNIEVSFYNQKQFLGLESCYASKYSSIIAHTTLVCICTILLEYFKRCNTDVRSFGAVFEDCKQELQEIHLNIALDTLINTFTGYVKELRDRKLLKKGCYEKALSLAHEMLSSWFTEQIAHVQDFVTRLREDLFPKKSRQNA